MPCSVGPDDRPVLTPRQPAAASAIVVPLFGYPAHVSPGCAMPTGVSLQFLMSSR